MNFNWKIPVRWCHAGLPQGNGLFGTLLWGDADKLKITFNRSDFWFYGNNLPPNKEQTYDNLKINLIKGNESEIKRIFGGFQQDGSRPLQSSRLPMGRLDIAFPERETGSSLLLDSNTSIGRFISEKLKIESIVPRGIPLLALSITGADCKKCVFSSIPADSDNVKAFYDNNLFPAFRKNDSSDNKSGGWFQEVPGSKTLCVYWEVSEQSDSSEVFLAASLENTASEAEAVARKMVATAAHKGFAIMAEETRSWWCEYWKKAPKITLPDKELSEIYYLGMYRFAGLCSPDAPAATLQGPWCEEHRMPPWSSDYHFNINVQECYWPAFGGNLAEFIMPLFDMIKKWKPVLGQYAENFAGIKDGQMLPHATDDRGVGLGGFWPGHIDHSCTAWIAQLMWLYWKYTSDDRFLRDTLRPFMESAMNVYEAMLEKDDEGNYFLRAECSPEYHENTINAWGRNPSIHLAAIHFLANSLLKISGKTNVSLEKCARWQEIISKLPVGSISPESGMCIWEGQPLDEPHRHFSHLAALHPFDLFDWRNSKKDAAIVSNSIARWIFRGTGSWAGWSFPWASIILSRVNRPEAAHIMLSIYRRAFMKEDYALRYRPTKTCFTVSCDPGVNPIMQVEAGMAAAAAVMEMLAHTSCGTLYLFAGTPSYWQDVSFSGIRAEGAFLIKGTKKDGIIKEFGILSEKGGIFKVLLPEGRFKIDRNGKIEFLDGEQIYETTTDIGETIIFMQLV